MFKIFRSGIKEEYSISQVCEFIWGVSIWANCEVLLKIVTERLGSKTGDDIQWRDEWSHSKQNVILPFLDGDGFKTNYYN